MPTNNNTEITKTIRDGLKIEQGIEDVPTEVGSKILPVFLVNQSIASGASTSQTLIVNDADANDALTNTIFTAHATKDTYLMGTTLTYKKDNINPGKTSYISCTPRGLGPTKINILNYVPLSSNDGFNTVMLPYPILLEKGTTVTVNNESATSIIFTTGSAFYFEV